MGYTQVGILWYGLFASRPWLICVIPAHCGRCSERLISALEEANIRSRHTATWHTGTLAHYHLAHYKQAACWKRVTLHIYQNVIFLCRLELGEDGMYNRLQNSSDRLLYDRQGLSLGQQVLLREGFKKKVT